jgi:hypothetical protein
MQIMCWSSLVSWPKVVRQQPALSAQLAPGGPANLPAQINFGASPSGTQLLADGHAHLHGHKLRDKLSRSRMREGIWIAMATAEIVYLLISWIGWR